MPHFTLLSFSFPFHSFSPPYPLSDPTVVPPCLVAVHGRDKAFLAKHFDPKSFLRQCPKAEYEQFVLTLNPLATVPFRLHTSFEMEHRLKRQRSVKRTTFVNFLHCKHA